MIQFLVKGLLRDKSRSLIPTIVVAVGVALSVFMHAYITGVMADMVQQTANFSSGHVKVTTRAYQDLSDQHPIDLALFNIAVVKEELQISFPQIEWVDRISFGALIDVPDSVGETKAQGPAFGMALDLLHPESREISRLNLESSIIQGRLPKNKKEALIAHDFAIKLDLHPGDSFTLMASTMYGNMAYYNFVLAGTLHFGSKAMDRGSFLIDISAAREVLDMNDASSEILGFFKSGFYEDEEAIILKAAFLESSVANADDEYAPVLSNLRDHPMMGMYLDLTSKMGLIINFVFLLAMSLVLWNAGLLGALRRYGEFGVRLAIGEEKSHLFRSLLLESAVIGFAGSILGTAFGLFFAYLLQTYGLNIETFSQSASQSVMMPNVIRAKITITDYYIGFIPGVVSTLIGSALAGIGIYKRKTANLFKEL